VRHLELRPQNTKDAVVVPLDPRSLRYRVFEVGVTAVPDVNHLEEQIVAGAATIADLSARVAELSSTAGAIAETANATNVQLRREIDARDAIIERLESADTRYRFEADELRRALDGRSAELENARTLADERLAVIRSLYEQGTRAAG
jgi:predicted RNase H-like nuclease (RuvC/YqgF family)